jgi:hypothetical protein
MNRFSGFFGPSLALFTLLICVLFIPFQSISQDSLAYAEESHFKNIRQLTFGGDNAEAYFSFDGKWLVFQKTNPKEGIPCDQIYI